MSISEKLGRAAAELGNAASETADYAKKKYEEKVTPEKRAEIKKKFDDGVEKADKILDTAAEKIEKGLKDFTDGFNSARNGEKK